jgi:hypothetical protein
MFRYSCPYFDRMISRAVAKEKPFDKQPLFQVLTDFMHAPSWQPVTGIGSGDESWSPQPMSSKYVISFQNFPRIRSIFGHRVAEKYETLVEDANTGYPAHTGMASSLKNLELKDSAIVQKNLRIVLKVLQALSTFTYEILTSRRFIWGSVIEVMHALVPHYHSLENLWLACTFERNLPAASIQVYDDIPLLSRFSRLKRLRIDAVLLEQLLRGNNGIPFRMSLYAVLPATLETLHIRYKSELILWDEVRRFILAKLDLVPQLKKIFIECSRYIKAPDDWQQLQEHAKNQDVDLVSLNSRGPWTFNLLL